MLPKTARLIAILVFVLTIVAVGTSSALADDTIGPVGQSSIRAMAKEWGLKNPESNYLLPVEDGGADARDAQGNPIPGLFNPATVTGAGPFGTLYPPSPAASMSFKTPSKMIQAMYERNIGGAGGFNGQVNSDLKDFIQKVQAANLTAKTVQYPPNAANQAKAQQMGQGIGASNAMGEMAKAQSSA